MKKICLAIWILLLPAIASAANVWHTSTIQFIYPQANGSVVVGFDLNNASCPNLETPTQYFFMAVGQNGVTADGMKNVLAALMLAFASDKTVSVEFDTATALCYIGRAKVLK
jgi:hypothetical protein